MSEMAVFDLIELYLSKTAKPALGVCGILANASAALILTRSRRLRGSSFNALLTALLIVHSLYIADGLGLDVYSFVRKGGGDGGDRLFHHVFSNFLFPCQPMLLYSSTCLTVLMARERCFAIKHPIAYRNRSLSGRTWRRALAQMALSLAVSAVFVLPLFFESEVRSSRVPTVVNYNGTYHVQVCIHILYN